MFNIDNITRENIKKLTPYSSARDEFEGEASVWLDANENPNDTDINRYPDPRQTTLKSAISQLKGIDSKQIFIGNGSDEAIDLLFRAFCEPGIDKAYIFPPTYGMYQVSARINNIDIVKINLDANFDLPPISEIKPEIDSNGLLFICSPNNPTGNTFSLEIIKGLADIFDGIVIVDEAYIDFSNAESALSLLETTPNLVVLQTMSKAWGVAGLRLGMAFASKDIIDILGKIKPPYNINTLSQVEGLKSLNNKELISNQIQEIKEEREALIVFLNDFDLVVKVYPTEANFILAEFKESKKVFTTLINQGIIIRDRNSEIRNCLRITVGTPAQNKVLIAALKDLNI